MADVKSFESMLVLYHHYQLLLNINIFRDCAEITNGEQFRQFEGTFVKRLFTTRRVTLGNWLFPSLGLI